MNTNAKLFGDLSGTLLDDHQLRAIVGGCQSLFYKRKAAGAYDFLLTRPQIGARTQYSGTLVQKWIDGAGKVQSRPQLVKPSARKAG